MANLFIFPSYREGLPVALMEAMASGLSCVASINRGTNDLLPDSKLLFEPSDTAGLKEKIKLAMTTDCSAEIKNNLDRLRSFDLKNVLSITKVLYVDEIHSGKKGSADE